jgi:dihydroorotate dehydrogenase electron transfer subunit
VRLGGDLEAVPGQFVMVWVPGVDEFPMSVSYPGKEFGITYQVLGEGTKALAKMAKGDKVGIRGPYGNGFSAKGKRLLMIGGGVGMAPVAPLVDIARAKRLSVDLVIGAKTKDDLIFERRATRAGAKVHVTTDDGTKGFKGFASELAIELMDTVEPDQVCACGPEKMIVKIAEAARRRKIPLQASLERHMKCGIGICDSCALDGVHVCKEGPVFSLEDLRRFGDLGRTKLDPAGRRVPV